MTHPPIVLFGYARPEHTRRTLQSLQNNDGASRHELIVYIDGPKSSVDASSVAEVADVVAQARSAGKFSRVTVHQALRNRGLAASVIAGVSQVLSEHESVIVLEDDLLLAPDFLEFMTAALCHYAGDERMWSVSGYSPPLPRFEDSGHDLYLSLRASSWGWGTWRRSWKQVDWDVEDYPTFEYNFAARRRFNRGGRDMAAMLDAQMDGRVDSWAIRWCYSQFKNSMYSVVPAVTKVHNIGLDGSGTHRVVDSAAAGPVSARAVKFEPLAPDPVVLREFAKRQRRFNKVPSYSFLRHLAAKRERRGP